MRFVTQGPFLNSRCLLPLTFVDSTSNFFDLRFATEKKFDVRFTAQGKKNMTFNSRPKRKIWPSIHCKKKKKVFNARFHASVSRCIKSQTPQVKRLKPPLIRSPCAVDPTSPVFKPRIIRNSLRKNSARTRSNWNSMLHLGNFLCCFR